MTFYAVEWEGSVLENEEDNTAVRVTQSMIETIYLAIVFAMHSIIKTLSCEVQLDFKLAQLRTMFLSMLANYLDGVLQDINKTFTHRRTSRWSFMQLGTLMRSLLSS